MAAVVRVRDICPTLQKELLHELVSDDVPQGNPRASLFVVDHRDSIVVVVRVRGSTLDVALLVRHPGVLGRAESREKADINKFVRELTHLAPPFGLSGILRVFREFLSSFQLHDIILFQFCQGRVSDGYIGNTFVILIGVS